MILNGVVAHMKLKRAMLTPLLITVRDCYGPKCKWDPELAKVAQKYANKCISDKHNPERQKKSKLSCDDINGILDYHNECRELVAGGRAKLIEARDTWVLKWDPELAKVAQKYANKCISDKHNPERLCIKFFYFHLFYLWYIENEANGTGENIAWHANSSRFFQGEIKELCETWYKEIGDWKPAEINPQFSHFTQSTNTRRKKANEVLLTRTGQSISHYMKAQRLRWERHVARSNPSGSLTMNASIEGKRPRGRP
ncbi:unnamed protein product [Nezara viridula]|uniref:SCP domain-containing protein n=1 Tax=Nezara viridula TaxID=85310 RepID=A0A9P0HTG7_NEZVI|nr:unnamed protein product [Nezara viridula]